MSTLNVVPVVPKYVIAKSNNSASHPMDEFLKFKGVDATSPLPSRKRKLDHLSVEEKIQRKKLKNRVAAQTSRDRKKAKMEDMEYKIQEQDIEISELRDECKSLQKERENLTNLYSKLEQRFIELEGRLADTELQLKEARMDAEIASRVIGSVTNCTNGSAAGIGSAVDYSKCKTEQQGPDFSFAQRNCSLPGLEVGFDLDNIPIEEIANSLLRDLAEEIADVATEQDFLPRTSARTKMGATTNNATARSSMDVKVEPTQIKQEQDSIFYDSSDENLLVHKMEPDYDDSEAETDDDADSIESVYSNDHNYNRTQKSPDSYPTSDPGYESQSSPTSGSDEEIPEMPGIINMEEFEPFMGPDFEGYGAVISDLFPMLA